MTRHDLSPREEIIATLADIVATVEHHDLARLPIRGKWSDGETLGDALSSLGEDLEKVLTHLHTLIATVRLS